MFRLLRSLGSVLHGQLVLAVTPLVKRPVLLVLAVTQLVKRPGHLVKRPGQLVLAVTQLWEEPVRLVQAVTQHVKRCEEMVINHFWTTTKQLIRFSCIQIWKNLLCKIGLTD